MIIKFPKLTKKGDVLLKEKSDEINPFSNCHLWDVFLEDLEEIKEFLKTVKLIYDDLPLWKQRENIYLNFKYGEKYVFASYEKEYLMFETPINYFLNFQNDEELDYYSTLIQHIHDEYRKRVR